MLLYWRIWAFMILPLKWSYATTAAAWRSISGKNYRCTVKAPFGPAKAKLGIVPGAIRSFSTIVEDWVIKMLSCPAATALVGLWGAGKRCAPF